MSAGLTFQNTSPGFFTADSSGTGAAAGIDEIDVDVNPYVVLYGTGIRHYAERLRAPPAGELSRWFTRAHRPRFRDWTR